MTGAEVSPKGRTPEGVLPGDFILKAGRDGFSPLVYLGQRLRYPESLARYTHAALVSDRDGGLIEATWRGVMRTHLSKYEGDEYVFVRVRSVPWDRAQALLFAESVADERYGYGYLGIVAVALWLLTGTRLWFGLSGSVFCSALVAEALTRSGFVWPKPPSMMLPADLAAYFGVADG
jgi:hypothetical protein